jgi:P27 family predicted phage terminase small subunit
MPATVSHEHKRLIGRTADTGAGGLPLPAALAPAGSTDIPEPPDNLQQTGRTEWLRLWAAGPWLIPEVDVTLMGMLCTAYDQRADMLAHIRMDGFMVPTSNDTLQAHPLITALRTLEALMTRWLTALGFTPTARSQLGISELTRVSKLEELMVRRNSGPR